MSTDYSEADYRRDLGITSWDQYDKELKGITESAGGSEWAEYDAELERINSGRNKLDELYEKALGINATQAEAEEALQQLREAEQAEEKTPVTESNAPARSTVSERRAPTQRHVGADEIQLASGKVIPVSELQMWKTRPGNMTFAETGTAWRR